VGKIVNWIKNDKVEFAILIAILVVGAFLRLYKIDEYMTFLGDEGRDAIVVRRLLVYFDPILIGPGTSIGNMYLGPLYYYLIAPSLLLAGFSPVGPSAFVALVGIATVFLVWKIGREWFPSTGSGQVAWGSLIAAFFYAISPTVIIFSRSSWNPNVMPFFALLSIYSIWRVWKHKEFKWLVVLGISYAFVLQSHYLGLLLAPVLFIFWFVSKVPIRYTLYATVLFLFLMSPLVIFDARHDWRNFVSMRKFFAVRQETVSIRPWNAIPKFYPIFEKVNIRLLAGKDDLAGKTISFAFVGLLFWLFVKRRKLIINHKRSLALCAWPLTIVLIWLAFALLGLGLYKQEIYDHYYGFFFPAPFLLIGALAQDTWTIANKTGKILIAAGFIYLVFLNFKESPLKYPPNQQLRRAKEVAQKISEESQDKNFNLAVIAERNYEAGYQYFLEMWGKKVVKIDAQKPDTITNQLFVVCEMEKAKCDPTHSPKAEVANFGWSKIGKEYIVFGTTLFKLVHTK